MLNLQSFVATLALISGVSANLYPIPKRNQEPSAPSCTDFTPFVYAGCFQDLSTPRALLFSGPNTQNMTVETCVAFCKGNQYKYAGLEYYGECFCGDSVNGPQVDESQCNFPCTGDKTETCGGNDLINIYQDPTFPVVDNTVITDYKFQGCYSEGTNGRSLAWRQNQILAANMTVEKCLSACKAGGYPIAGIEYASECYCGVVLGNGTIPIDSSNCNMACKGDSTEICGGSKALDLYVANDLESSQPCGVASSSSSSTVTSTTTSSVYSSTSSTVATTSSVYSSSSSSSSSNPPSTTSSSSPSSSSSSSSSSSVPQSTTSSSVSSTRSSSSISSTVVPTTSSSSSSSPPPPTTSPASTKTTASLCTTTITQSATPTCEYKCGNWCSNPIPKFTDSGSCWQAFSSCTVQTAACFLKAGFPDSMNCFEFSSWCSKISTYCNSYCPGNNCSKEGCKSKYPPSGPAVPSPAVSTSVYVCPVASAMPSTTAKPSTSTSSTSCVPVPTSSNICTQPTNNRYGYNGQNPVGQIALPCLTCNNVKQEYQQGNCFKLYIDSDTNKCPSYGRTQPSQGCKDACDSQYRQCAGTYAQGCKNNKRWGDSYDSANQKCYAQWQDCYDQNRYVSGNNRCGSYNSGWY